MEISKFEAEMLQGALHYYVTKCEESEHFKEDMSHYHDLLNKLSKFTGEKEEICQKQQ
jgi:hypothetical protein